jgi:hypothetical protein
VNPDSQVSIRHLELKRWHSFCTSPRVC